MMIYWAFLSLSACCFVIGRITGRFEQDSMNPWGHPLLRTTVSWPDRLVILVMLAAAAFDMISILREFVGGLR